MADIKISDVTDGEIDGTGVFDKLMTTVNKHLESQFAQSRIQGTDYANVYLGSLSAVLQQSIQFVLGEQAADKQAELLTQQVLTQVETTGLTAEQRNKVLAEIALLQQKTKTEIAQIVENVDGVLVAGVVGKQKTLFNNQAEGFHRDAEQKAAKLLTDTWSVRHTKDPGAALPDTINKLNDGSIGAAITALQSGVSSQTP